jgi:hypothetical protein
MMPIPVARAKGPLYSPFANLECGRYFPRILTLAAHLLHSFSPEAQPSFLPAARLLLNTLREWTLKAGWMQVAAPILPIGVLNNINITVIHDGVNNRTNVLVQSIT